jgi:formyltetrahydrofolate hydrolase
MMSKPDARRKKEQQIAHMLAKIGFEVRTAPQNGKRMVIVVKKKAHCIQGGA